MTYHRYEFCYRSRFAVTADTNFTPRPWSSASFTSCGTTIPIRPDWKLHPPFVDTSVTSGKRRLRMILGDGNGKWFWMIAMQPLFAFESFTTKKGIRACACKKGREWTAGCFRNLLTFEQHCQAKTCVEVSIFESFWPPNSPEQANGMLECMLIVHRL